MQQPHASGTALTPAAHSGGWGGHLVLAHAVAGVQDDPFARHQDVVWRVVVEAVVGHAAVLQLKQTHRSRRQSSFSVDRLRVRVRVSHLLI